MKDWLVPLEMVGIAQTGVEALLMYTVVVDRGKVTVALQPKLVGDAKLLVDAYSDTMYVELPDV